VNYQDFLSCKIVSAQDRGMDVGRAKLAMKAPYKFKPHQYDLAKWNIQGGNRATFSNFGTGKTAIQTAVIEFILRRLKQRGTDGPALIVCPLGVRSQFMQDAERFFGVKLRYVRNNADLETDYASGERFFLSNYERIRNGQLDPALFQVTTLDEAAVLRSFGSKTYQTFLPMFDRVPFKYVATAIPSPNRHKELIHYAGFLGIMDTGQALTRFFKRDPKKAGNLRIHPHKEKEFWLWVSTWATFLTKPSDLGYSDDGYDLPPLKITTHRLPVDHSTAGYDSWGQGKLIRSAATGLKDAAHEKRDSLVDRVEKTRQIIAEGAPNKHWIIWHTLEDERRAIQKAIPESVAVYGTEELDEREERVAAFSDGEFRILSTKPELCGSGCNFQRHCYSAIFMSLNYKAHDIIQAVYRIQRFLQPHEVELHFVYTESEDPIYDEVMRKWKEHQELQQQMSNIIKEFGLNNAQKEAVMRRAIGLTRQEKNGALYTAVNNDNVLEMENYPDNSVDLVVSSWPFSTHYEYVASYNDFGHNSGDDTFFEQMDYLTPHMLRALKPGRFYCVHCKDRLLYGSVTNLGMYSVNPFSDKCVDHLRKHGFIYCGRITIDTDVVRENSQTYRLGWTENSKDGTKMGVGSPEYILLFRKLPTDQARSYADNPVPHDKDAYSRSRWQFDASPIWRTSGERFLTPEEVRTLPQTALRAIWHKFSWDTVYNFEEHVRTAELLEKEGMLPAAFMLLPPAVHSPWIWDDVVRMQTLNTEQSKSRLEQHICPLQFTVVDRLINRYSNPGEIVLDPFAGLFTVPYRAVKLGRRGTGIELSAEYWHDGVRYLRAAEQEISTPTLFDALEVVA
jgi:DNA modification methylase